jgi:hypothetical protein
VHEVAQDAAADTSVVYVAQWRPDSLETRRIAEKYRRPYFLAGVARKD